MTTAHSLAELQRDHVILELECIDRMYLNAYVPQLTSEGGVASYRRGYLGYRFASTKQVAAKTEAFVKAIQHFIRTQSVDLVRFHKGQRKDEVLQAKLRRFKPEEGVIFVGVAQEKVRVPRTTRKRWEGGGTVPWLMYSTALVNVYYFYCRDAFQALDNGLLECADIRAAQRISDGLSRAKIDALFRKWRARLPHPFSAQERTDGYRYDLSMLQVEFSLTQIWDQARYGRCFFEEVIRENIDLGRPEQVPLIFARRMQRQTATDGRCRTRQGGDCLLPRGVLSSLLGNRPGLRHRGIQDQPDRGRWRLHRGL